MPYEISQRGSILHVRFFGILTSEDFVNLLQYFMSIEGAPNRISTLTDITDFDIRFSTMFPIAQQRREQIIPSNIKSAIVASKPLEIGIARMFQTLNTNPNISIQIFPSESEAITWVSHP
jgi:hypothetical protein